MNFSPDWASILIPIFIQIGLLVYFLGVIRTQIDALGGRIARLEDDTEKERDSSLRIGERVHELALATVRVETMLSEIKVRVEALCLEASDCPLAQGIPPRLRRQRKTSSQSVEEEV